MPCSSASTCTSTWRAVVEVRLAEHRRVAERGGRLGPRRDDLAIEGVEGAHDAHAPPAAAGRRLDQHRQVGVASPTSGASSASTGTPAAAISRFASIFEPIAAIACAGGPIHVSPASATAPAKPAFSDRKP